MDPMQIQNQQNMGAFQQPQQQQMPQQQVQYIPQQQIPQQPVQPAVQQEWVFDKILKWLVDFIGKMVAPAPATNNQQANIQWQYVPQQMPQPAQQMPWANLFNTIWSTLNQIGNQAEQLVQTWVQSTQSYVADQPVIPVNTQQLLTQNYQPNSFVQQPQQQIPQQQIVNPVVPQQPVIENTIQQVSEQPQQQVPQQPAAPINQ